MFPKKRSLVLILIALLFAKTSSTPTFAQTGIIINRPGTYLVLTVNELKCVDNIYLVKPEERIIAENLASSDNPYPQVPIGRFDAGDEIVLKITSPCASTELYSNNLNHAEVIPEADRYLIQWKRPEEPDFSEAFAGMMIYKARDQHPVVFVHGLGGLPSDWEEGGNKDVYFRTLKTAPYNYRNDFLYAYHYSDADSNPETYDNQGDIRLISKGLKEDVDRLANFYYYGCEKECVDLVGFSLGGMVIRQYLYDHPDDHKIRKAITIASPHRGAWVLDPEDWLDKEGFDNATVREYLREAISDIVSFLGLADLDLASEAVQEIRPDSNYLTKLNEKQINNTDMETFYGQIDARLTTKVFLFELQKQMDIGDGLILGTSAAGIPADNLQKHPLTDDAIIELQSDLIEKERMYEYSIDILGLEDWKYYHNNIIRRPEVVEGVTNLLYR